jgi:hypothetical protein
MMWEAGMAGEKLSPDSVERGPGKAASKLPTAYGDVHTAIVELLETARRAAARSVNALMTASYWEIGRRIVEFEQGGKDRAKYGEALIERLAADLTQRVGRGFSRQNLWQMRQFFLVWPIAQTLSAKSSPPQIVQTPSGQFPEIAGGLGEGRQPRRGRGAEAHLPRAARRLRARNSRRVPAGARRLPRPPQRRQADLPGGRPANGLQLDWDDYTPPKPNQVGDHIFTDYDLAELRPYIDWTHFFHTWEMKDSYPQILDDAEKGEEARKLWAGAQAMLDRIIAEIWLEARAEVSFFAANSVGDDIEIRPDDKQDELIGVLHCLRQQKQQPQVKPNLSLADYIAPKESGKLDWIGLFACTVGIGIEDKLTEFAVTHDDYTAIMLKVLADRLAEAFAERLHELVRKELWGYAAADALSNDALIEERYQGIRPAPGYPACPDHTEKGVIWGLSQTEEDIGITLTETYAMNPAASVSGLYIAYPEAKYFALGEIRRDRTGSGGELCEAEGDGGGGGGAVVGAQPRVLSQIFAATKIDGPALHLG